MAYETKVILMLLARQIGSAETLKEAYEHVAAAANTEDLNLPNYEDFRKELQNLRRNDE